MKRIAGVLFACLLIFAPQMAAFAGTYTLNGDSVTITVPTTSATEANTITGNGTVTYHADPNTSNAYYAIGGSNLSGMTGTVNLENLRLRVYSQNDLGPTTGVSYYVKDGAQLWVNGNVGSTTVYLNGYGLAGGDYNAQGALRFEGTSSLGGNVILQSDAAISTFYNTETGASKTLSAAVDLGSNSLYLGCGPNFDPTSMSWGTAYWFTDLTVSGKVSGTGKLIVRNTKSIFLTNAANDFTGGVEIQKGTLSLSNTAVLGGNEVNAVSIGSEGILRVSGGTCSAAKVTGSGTILYGGGASGYVDVNVNTSTWDASEFIGTAVLDHVRLRLVTQKQLGASSVKVSVKDGAQLWLIESGATPITADVTIAGMGYGTSNDAQGAIRFEKESKLAGTLTLAADAAISTYYNQETGAQKDLKSAVNLASHTLYLGAGKDYDMANWVATKTVGNQFTDLTVSGKISGTGSLVINNEKTIFLTNTANDFTGGTTIKHGTLSIADTRALGKGTTTVQANGILTLSNSDAENTASVPVSVLAGGKVRITSGTVPVNVTLADGAEMKVTDSIQRGSLSGTGTVTYSSAGFNGGMTLTNVNAAAFSGTVNVEKCRLKVENQSKLGTTGVTVNVADGAQLWLIGSGLVQGTFNLAGMGTAANTGGQGAIRLEGGSKIAGQINLTADSCIGTFYSTEVGNAKEILANVNLNDHTLWLGSSSNYPASDWTNTGYWFTDLTVSGKVSGSGGLTINTNKTVYLTSASDYSGPTAVKVGTLALNAENAIALSSSVTNDAAITFSKDQIFNNLSGTGTITGTNGASLLLNSTENTTFTGTINASSVTFADDGNSTAALTLTNAIQGLESLNLTINTTQNSSDHLTVKTFDPNQTELFVQLEAQSGLTPGMLFPILTVTEGTLPDYDWQSLLSAVNSSQWLLFLSGDGKSLMAGTNGNSLPEPASVWLFLLGMGWFGWLVKRNGCVARKLVG